MYNVYNSWEEYTDINNETWEGVWNTTKFTRKNNNLHVENNGKTLANVNGKQCDFNNDYIIIECSFNSTKNDDYCKFDDIKLICN